MLGALGALGALEVLGALETLKKLKNGGGGAKMVNFSLQRKIYSLIL